jgi:4-hydroxy-tetrahydrodipicolinate reductase
MSYKSERPRWKVIQFATGNVGRLALQGILDHPDLDLVGLWVHSAEKAGRDAGELCGRAPVGVLATNDFGAILALDAGAVSHNSTGDLRPAEAAAEIAALPSRERTSSSALISLLHPGTADRAMVEKLEAACAAGQTSCFTSGIDPGFANDLLPLTLSGFSARVDSIRVSEILNYDTYDQATVLFDTMGFGRPMDNVPFLLLPGVLAYAWGAAIHLMAEGLGVEVDEIRERRAPAPETFEIAAGTVEAGTVAGLRFEIEGIVDGEPVLTVEHVTRLRDDLAPEWPAPPEGGGYRIEVKGSPSFRCELSMLGEDGDHNTGGLLGTAMRLLNAIPAVCAAPPGLLTPFDLPLVTGHRSRQA